MSSNKPSKIHCLLKGVHGTKPSSRPKLNNFEPLEHIPRQIAASSPDQGAILLTCKCHHHTCVGHHTRRHGDQPGQALQQNTRDHYFKSQNPSSCRARSQQTDALQNVEVINLFSPHNFYLLVTDLVQTQRAKGGPILRRPESCQRVKLSSTRCRGSSSLHVLTQDLKLRWSTTTNTTHRQPRKARNPTSWQLPSSKVEQRHSPFRMSFLLRTPRRRLLRLSRPLLSLTTERISPPLFFLLWPPFLLPPRPSFLLLAKPSSLPLLRPSPPQPPKLYILPSILYQTQSQHLHFKAQHQQQPWLRQTIFSRTTRWTGCRLMTRWT